MVLLVPAAAGVAAAATTAMDAEPVVVAGPGREVPVEGFMELSGRLVVEADGRVSAYAIDHADAVPGDVRAFLGRRVMAWRVALDAGVVVPEEPVGFHVRVRASPAGDGLYRLWLDGVRLDEVLPAAQRLQSIHRRRPEYPRAMASVGASGIVYMQVLVGADGRVEDVFAEQVDLTAMPADPADFAQYQLEFMASAATAARQWRFKVPSEGPYAGTQRQVVRIPLVYFMHDRPMAAYGQWEYLVRGVHKHPPWQSGADADAGRAMASLGMQPARSRMRVVDAGDGYEG